MPMQRPCQVYASKHRASFGGKLGGATLAHTLAPCGTLCRPCVGLSCWHESCISNIRANVGGLLCWHEFCISKIHANFGGAPCFDPGGGGWPVL